MSIWVNTVSTNLFRLLLLLLFCALFVLSPRHAYSQSALEFYINSERQKQVKPLDNQARRAVRSTRSRVKRHRRPLRKTARTTARPQQQVLERRVVEQAALKSETALHVLTVGDFFAASIGRALEGYFLHSSDVVVLQDINSASGLVRADYYDWRGVLSGLVASHKAQVIVIGLGSNDVQAFSGAISAEFGTPEWHQLYSQHVDAFVTALVETGLPFVWVLVPPVQRQGLSQNYALVNAIVAERFFQAQKDEKFRGVLIDPWDVFADDNKNFMMSGPDLDGRVQMLRTSDGTHFTRAGLSVLAQHMVHKLPDLLTKQALTSLQNPVPQADFQAASDGQPYRNPVRPGLGHYPFVSVYRFDGSGFIDLSAQSQTQDLLRSSDIVRPDPFSVSFPQDLGEGRMDDFIMPQLCEGNACGNKQN